MRSALLLSATLLLQLDATACTFFKVTQNGYTMVGNNEDAWSINARIRFENGKPGEYGVVYLCHFNGSPLRSMMDQGGMNEAGLMYDGLVVEPKQVHPRRGAQAMDHQDMIHRVMRSCSTVREAEAFISTLDLTAMSHSMLVIVDRNGDYLIVENDTLIIGHDPKVVFGNFRPSACTNLDAVPIPRFQKGRALVSHGADTSLATCTTVMDSMRSCRVKLGNGTLYTNIFDPQRGLVHLYFYHDFSEVRTFNLKEELAKGDYSMEMASLFGKRPEYDGLVAYFTPFHQRGIFWFLLAVALAGMITGLYAAFALLRKVVARLRSRKSVGSAWPLLAMGISSAVLIFLVPVLLLNEGVYYFGLDDALDNILPMLVYLPLLLCALSVPLLVWTFQRWHSRTDAVGERWLLVVFTTMQCVMLGMLFYWDMVLV